MPSTAKVPNASTYVCATALAAHTRACTSGVLLIRERPRGADSSPSFREQVYTAATHAAALVDACWLVARRARVPGVRVGRDVSSDHDVGRGADVTVHSAKAASTAITSGSPQNITVSVRRRGAQARA